MKTLRSKRHILYFWGLLAVVAIFMIGFGGLATYPFFSHYGIRETTTGEKTALVFGIFCSVSYVYVAWSIWEQAPNWVVDTEKLIYDHKETFYWKDLERMDLTGKYYSDRLWRRAEGVRMIFTGNKEVIFFDDKYQNLGSMKLFLEQVVQQKHPVIPEPLVGERETGKLLIYKGSVWRSFLFYLLLSLIFMFSFVFTNSVNQGPLGYSMYAGFVFVLWQLVGRSLYNVRLSDRELIIKNSLWPGYQKVLAIENIREVVYELKGKGMTTLTVIRKDFKTESFIADGLSNREWLGLRDQLRQKGLKVRNECIPSETEEPEMERQ